MQIFDTKAVVLSILNRIHGRSAQNLCARVVDRDGEAHNPQVERSCPASGETGPPRDMHRILLPILGVDRPGLGQAEDSDLEWALTQGGVAHPCRGAFVGCRAFLGWALTQTGLTASGQTGGQGGVSCLSCV